MIISKDQMGNLVQLEKFPIRIISLVPSQTELLYDLKLENEVVGITKFCIHPDEWFRTKTRIGGTKNVNIEKVKSLNPDLIIGNKEENTEQDILELQTIASVWMSDIDTLQQSIEMILEIGKMTNRVNEGKELVTRIKHNFEEIKPTQKWTCLYFMWKDPYFTVGKNTFIDAMIQQCGGINLQETERYPEWDFSKNISPDVILLSSEPYPFTEEHISFFQSKYPSSKICLVDGEYFSWYGSRLEKAPSYFRSLLNDIL